MKQKLDCLTLQTVYRFVIKFSQNKTVTFLIHMLDENMYILGYQRKRHSQNRTAHHFSIKALAGIAFCGTSVLKTHKDINIIVILFPSICLRYLKISA